MTIKTNLKAGARSWQHNQAVRAPLTMKTGLKAGSHTWQHNQPAGLRVKLQRGS